CIGVVEDVSITGIRICQIPSHFGEHSQKCFSIMHGPLQDFKLMLKAKWRSETKKEMYQMIGFQVVNPTVKWKKFLAVTLASMGVNKSLPDYEAENSVLIMDKKRNSSPFDESSPACKRRNNNEEQDPYSIALFLAALISDNTTFARGKGGAGRRDSTRVSSSAMPRSNSMKNTSEKKQQNRCMEQNREREQG
ncbi:MAG: hypothetical protein PHZ02_05065, partial [Desulfocapsaceae bacterium]|nr:hypothetical protein [Desulfocapsaceae bacterium]